MTNYTLTAEQRGQLMTDLAKAYISSEALSMLQSLQPNTQEPVASIDLSTNSGFINWRESPHDFPDGTELYTHPAPQQKSLTDEQITEIAKPFINTVGDYWCNENAIRDNGNVEAFARAIEAAHNIGVKP